jgi:hypothetical protein
MDKAKVVADVIDELERLDEQSFIFQGGKTFPLLVWPPEEQIRDRKWVVHVGVDTRHDWVYDPKTGRQVKLYQRGAHGLWKSTFIWPERRGTNCTKRLVEDAVQAVKRALDPAFELDEDELYWE